MGASRSDTDKNFLKLGGLVESAYKDIVLTINQAISSGKIAFSSIKNCKSNDFPEGNFTLVWKCPVKKYTHGSKVDIEERVFKLAPRRCEPRP